MLFCFELISSIFCLLQLWQISNNPRKTDIENLLYGPVVYSVEKSNVKDNQYVADNFSISSIPYALKEHIWNLVFEIQIFVGSSSSRSKMLFKIGVLNMWKPVCWSLFLIKL